MSEIATATVWLYDSSRREAAADRVRTTASEHANAMTMTTPSARRRIIADSSSPTSSREEAQAHGAARVVEVGVDEHDALPGPEGGLAGEDRDRDRRRHDHRQDVVGAVAGRAVRMPVPIVAREEALERGH